FRYDSPGDVVPTDAIFLDERRLLVLHRGFSRLKGVSAMIGIVDVEAIRPGATVVPRELARLAPPLTLDNMEGIAVRRERGQTAIYILSDDNFSGAQRTVLMKFALPAGRR
ncbi:MAG: esterase-like activity of phytase family protein, partial [Alphaproteobacteria bacterium]|nr:esterase-like activity of phytase family protein [Alphaproteobacteria bacterium]